MPTVREAAYRIFEHFGVDRLFGNPGSTELPMLKAMPEGFRYVLGLNEAVVVGMADGFARASGLPALVNLHSSAGTGHSLGNLFTAFRNNAPVVVTAGQQARSILPHDPFLYAERATEFPRPYVKWALEPARAEDVPHALVRAFVTALTPPMGPVFVSIPVDDWERECEMPDLPDARARPGPRARRADPDRRHARQCEEPGDRDRHRGRQLRRLAGGDRPGREERRERVGRTLCRARNLSRGPPAIRGLPPGVARQAPHTARSARRDPRLRRAGVHLSRRGHRPALARAMHRSPRCPRSRSTSPRCRAGSACSAISARGSKRSLGG